MRKTRVCNQHLGFLAGLLSILILSIVPAIAGEPHKFTLINVAVDGTKIWLPSSVVVYQGDEVEITLINKLDEPHGFQISDVGITTVVQPKEQAKVTFTAAKSGVHSFGCQMHPAHLGGQFVVLPKVSHARTGTPPRPR
jgi:plastocyanin